MAPAVVELVGGTNLRMVTGDGENSYATNSTLQAKAIMENKAIMEAAVESICDSLSAAVAGRSSSETMVVADLGCSSGPNTLLVVAEVVAAVEAYHRKKKKKAMIMEVQFFLNDLPGNDFNLVFKSMAAKEEYPVMAAAETPSAYVAGLPGSFYTRLFPRRSVHLFHSSFSLMWRSKVPDELSNGDYVNQGNIYIGKTTSPKVVQLFRDQFQSDLKLFLKLRSEELVSDGKMMLTFLGRKSEEMLTHGEVGTMWELLAKSLQCLVLKGVIKGEKLNTFNLPFYAPSVVEVESLITHTNLFTIDNMRVFESSWDPTPTMDASSSGGNVAKVVRAVVEPLIVDHFGDEIDLHQLFMEFSDAVDEHLEKGVAEYPVIVVSLNKAADIVVE